MNLLNFIEKTLVPIANKINSNKYVNAIKTGMVATIPITIAGSIFLLLGNLPIGGSIQSYQENFINPIFGSPEVFTAPFIITMNLLGLYVALTITQALAKHYKLDPVGAINISLGVYLISIVGPTIASGAFVENNGMLALEAMGSASIFGAIIIAIISVEIFNFCIKNNIRIKLPSQVPPEVSKPFDVIIPITLALIPFWIFSVVFGYNIHGLINNLLQPLSGFLAGNNLWGILLAIFMANLLWTFGIHGASIVYSALAGPFYLKAFNANAAAFAAGEMIPNIITEQFLFYTSLGGSGATIGFIIAVFLVARKQNQLSSIAKISILPGIFNINEPIIFGAPIVLNPIMMFPFILAPLATATVAFITIQLGWVSRFVASIPWTTPVPIGVWIGTAFDWRAVILGFILFAVATVVYLPFVKVYAKVLDQQEAANQDS